MKKFSLLALCLAIFHSPDGKEIRIDTAHITAVRSADSVKHHLAPGTQTVIYTGSQNFGVTEPADAVETLIEECT